MIWDILYVEPDLNHSDSLRVFLRIDSLDIFFYVMIFRNIF